MLGWSQFTKGHNSVKTVDGIMVLYLCISTDDALYLYQVSRKYLKGFQSYCEDVVCIPKFSKGHNSVNSVGGVMVLVLSTSSDSVLYLYQVLSKYLMGFRVTDLNTRVMLGWSQKLTDGHTGGQTDRKPDPYIAPCLRQALQKGTLRYQHLRYQELAVFGVFPDGLQLFSHLMYSAQKLTLLHSEMPKLCTILTFLSVKRSKLFLKLTRTTRD